ncbi:MAG: lipoyl(octanoyl) transferase LipB [Alphaproteobacteria bacterium]|nr:lipoyl(octanoyl) transferase LipB [Alphaproteobacteria bacterium]MCB9695168.1 lipoyl(octanoyl) transferase LipB [Alphaproteobacteria bacterium]
MKLLHLQGEGRTDYATVHELQRDLLARRVRGEVDDTIVVVEHPEVITVGRARGAEGSVLVPGDVPVVRVERGGDATWHGPGQLVAYPIVALEGRRRDLHAHLRHLEEAVIGVLGDLGLEGRRDPRNTGVWLTDPDGEVRKVCSVGIACRSWVTWHGLALNVDPDPRAWERIRPCGFSPDVMTSLARVMARPPKVEELVGPLYEHLCRTLVVE